MGIVGSHAYGLNTPTSDIDKAGVFVLPTREILGLKKMNETVHQVKVADGDLDLTLHEVGKYVSLALQANPTALEYLWLDSYEVRDLHGDMLLEIREAFLSKRVRDSYIGYASQQVHRLVGRKGTFDPDLKKRTAKHARHCTRLLIQVEHLMEFGALKVKLTEEQAKFCRAMGALAESDHERFASEALERIAFLKEMPSVLPDAPDDAIVNDVLLEIRGDFWRVGS
jgi:predicted nucleotidyltransferase